MQDTKLYSQYIELNNVINEFIKETGKEVDVKNLCKRFYWFYFKYYATDESKEKLQNALLELNKDISFESDVVGWSSVIATGVGIALLDLSIPVTVISVSFYAGSIKINSQNIII